MWRKNALFWGLLAVGFIWLAQTVGSPVGRFDRSGEALGDARPAAIRQTVDRVNRAMRAEWVARARTPAEQAPVLTVARRLSLALCGTIPSLEEIRWIEADRSAHPMAHWVDHLLADRRCADYLAERLARCLVGVEEGPFLLYRRRRFVHWLSDGLYENRPYDAIVREIVAGEGLWTDQPATNFVTVTIADEAHGPDENKLAVRVCRAMLGLRIDCAQCHDHPFEPRWRQSDFQGLAAFFAGTEQSLTGIHDRAVAYQVEDRETGETTEVQPAVPFDPQLLPDEGTPRARLAGWLTDVGNRPFARATVNRMWALLFGRGLVEPVDDLPIDSAFPPALDLLATDFATHGYDLRRLVRLIAATDAFQLESRASSVSPRQEPSQDGPFGWARFPLTRLRPEQVAGGLLQSASLTTIDAQSPIVLRVLHDLREADFVARYGDAGPAEFSRTSGTIPQRLLMLNGNLVFEATKDDLIGNAVTRVARFTPNDRRAVEVVYLMILTRRPTDEEAVYFQRALAGSEGALRTEQVEDLAWTLLNTTEFSWNH